MNTDESDSAVQDSNESQCWGPFAPWPGARPWIWAGLACLVAFFQLGLFLSEFQIEEGRGNDFFQDWASARNVIEGVPVYRSHELAIDEYLDLDESVEIQIPYNAHPPASVIWMLPFGLLSYPTGTLIWNLLSLVAILVAVAILLKTLCRPIAAWSVFPIFVLALTSYPLRMQFYLGQWNGFLLLLLVLGWYADRSGREASAGVILGIATLLKLFPGFILLVMLVRWRWRGVIWGGGTIAIGSLLTWMVLGTEAHLDYFNLVMPSLQNYVGDPVNCSLRGHWTKLFDPSNNAIEVTLIPPVHSPLLVKLLSGISIATVVLAGLWYCRKASTDLSHALAWVVMLLASPIAWDHYLILLVFPLILIWRSLGPGSRWGILLLILIISVQARNPYSHPSEGVIRTFHWPFTVTILSYQTYALLATGLWLVFLIRREDRTAGNLPQEA